MTDPAFDPPPRRGRVRRLLQILLVLLAVWIGWEIATWPDVAALKDRRPITTAFIEKYKHGGLLGRLTGKEREVEWKWVHYSRISSNLKRAVEEHGRGGERLQSSRRIKAKVLPWAFSGMGLLMVTFILGGGAHTRAIPSWIHGGIGYLSLGYSFLALLVEGYYLLQQNSLVNAFQRELLGARD